jgi:tetratricopeptide (TPR) repeat protein
LTGAAPFATYRKLPARDVIARMISDRQPGAPGLRPLNASIAPAVEAIVLKCLCADPARRYQNARELQEDLQRQLESRPLKHAPNPSLWERGQKFRRRHPKLTSATSVACIAALLLAGLGSIFVYREEQHAVRREQHARLEAKATLSRFQDDAKNSYFLLTARSAKRQIDEGAQACKAALQHFQILDNPAWRESAAVERLSDKDRQTLEREAGQLLILLAQAQQMAGDQELDPEKRAAFFQEGLHLCSLASGCFPAEQTPRALWQQQGDLHQRLNARAEAQKHFDRAKKAEFATANDRYLTARQLAEEGKFLAALPLVREAVAMKPHDFNFNFLQGICHDHLGQYKEAIGCYRSCIALRPDFFAPWYNRGLSQLRLNQWEAALGDLNQAEKLRPEFTEIYLHRAVALQGLKKHDDAIKDLSVALERKFAETRAYLLRAKLREKVNDMDGAKKDLTEGLRHDPTDDLGWIARGLAHLPEEPKKALADFDEALKLNPRSFAALQNKAHVLGKYFRRLDDAIKVLDKAVELYPDNPLPRAGRGVYLGRQGKRDAALADAKAALTLDSSPSNLYQVAGIYALTSKQEPEDQREAIALLKQALRNGFGYEHMNVDRDLDPIRESPVFRQLLDGARVLGSAGTTRGRN